MMHKVYGPCSAAVLGLVGLMALPLPAADPIPAAESRQEAHAGDVELLTEAYRLAEFAEKHKSPEAYIAAGGLVLKLKALTRGGLGELNVKPEVLDENEKLVPGARAEAQKPESLDELAQEFFDAASGLGAELRLSNQVEALVKAAKAREYAPGTRGAIGGPKWFVRPLGARQTHVYRIPFDTYTVGAIGFQSNFP